MDRPCRYSCSSRVLRERNSLRTRSRVEGLGEGERPREGEGEDLRPSWGSLAAEAELMLRVDGRRQQERSSTFVDLNVWKGHAAQIQVRKRRMFFAVPGMPHPCLSNG